MINPVTKYKAWLVIAAVGAATLPLQYVPNSLSLATALISMMVAMALWPDVRDIS